MKYYFCAKCDNVFIGSDIDQQVFCDCGDNQHLRNIQRMEYNELVQAKKDGMNYKEYQERKRLNNIAELGEWIHEGYERRHKGVR